MLVPMGILSAVSVLFGVMPGLPISVISKVLALAGITPPSYSLFEVNTPIGTWQVGTITILILLGAVIGFVFLRSGNKKVRYVDAYTCGVTDLDTDRINPAAQNLFETPVKLVKKLHAAIVPIFGDGEEAEEE